MRIEYGKRLLAKLSSRILVGELGVARCDEHWSERSHFLGGALNQEEHNYGVQPLDRPIPVRSQR